MTKPGTQTPQEWCTLSWFGAEFWLLNLFVFWLGRKLALWGSRNFGKGASHGFIFKTSVTFSWAGATKRLWDFGFPSNFQGLWWPNFPLLTQQMVATNKMVKQSQKKIRENRSLNMGMNCLNNLQKMGRVAQNVETWCKVGPYQLYPCKWPYKWVTGVISSLLIDVRTPFTTGRGPPCGSAKIKSLLPMILMHQEFIDLPLRGSCWWRSLCKK